MTEKNPLSPPRDSAGRAAANDSMNQRRSLKEELDLKKVRMLELETENGELKTLIEQMTKEVQLLKDSSKKY